MGVGGQGPPASSGTTEAACGHHPQQHKAELELGEGAERLAEQDTELQGGQVVAGGQDDALVQRQILEQAEA
jgi:hypothetical protein